MPTHAVFSADDIPRLNTFHVHAHVITGIGCLLPGASIKLFDSLDC
jgi:hypothetical protein